MKRITSFILSLLMIFAASTVLFGCKDDKTPAAETVAATTAGTESAVEKFVRENESALLDKFEESFATGSGYTCQSTIEAIGNGFVVDITVNEFDNIDDETKKLIQDTYDSMGSAFHPTLAQMQKTIPEIEYFKINIFEKSGGRIATILIGEE